MMKKEDNGQKIDQHYFSQIQLLTLWDKYQIW